MAALAFDEGGQRNKLFWVVQEHALEFHGHETLPVRIVGGNGGGVSADQRLDWGDRSRS